MLFAWPALLATLLAGPLVVLALWYFLRRRRRFAVSYASLSLLREAVPTPSPWRRRLPLALFLLALASVAMATARPHAVVAVPVNRMSIILAIDVSRSMCATDVDPNRLTVAQEVARQFVKDQATGARVGIVAFAGTAQLVVPASTDTDAAIEAIDSFTAGRGTAIGTAILRSIDAVAESNPNVARSGLPLEGGAAPAREPGTHEPDIVVLLTDGATTQGVNPLQAAEQAADRGLRVYTIGFGTENAAPLVCSPEQLGSDVFRGGFGSPGAFGADAARSRRILAIDEPTLQSIADMTGGTYFRAQDAAELVEVFRTLPGAIALQEQETEVSFAFAALAALFTVAAVGTSVALRR